MGAAPNVREARPQALAGRTIVVTRPAAQARALADGIVAAGGVPILFPALEIVDVADPAPMRAVAVRLDEFDLAIFISANAVEKALARISAQRAWPSTVKVATVGKSSERALARYGVSGVIAPRERFDSEALLELTPLSEPAVRGKRVVIFRGDGGRELLAEALAARGASVEYVECYRRRKPQLDPKPLLELWAHDRLDAITITSSEGLRNIWDMVGPGGRDRMIDTLLFAPHRRIAAQAHALGLRRVILTEPGDQGLLAGLIARFAGESNRE